MIKNYIKEENIWNGVILVIIIFNVCFIHPHMVGSHVASKGDIVLLFLCPSHNPIYI